MFPFSPWMTLGQGHMDQSRRNHVIAEIPPGWGRWSKRHGCQLTCKSNVQGTWRLFGLCPAIGMWVLPASLATRACSQEIALWCNMILKTLTWRTCYCAQLGSLYKLLKFGEWAQGSTHPAAIQDKPHIVSSLCYYWNHHLRSWSGLPLPLRGPFQIIPGNMWTYSTSCLSKKGSFFNDSEGRGGEREGLVTVKDWIMNHNGERNLWELLMSMCFRCTREGFGQEALITRPLNKDICARNVFRRACWLEGQSP